MEKLKWLYRLGFLVCGVLVVLIIKDFFRGKSEVTELYIGDSVEDIQDFVSADQKLEKIENYKNCIVIPSLDIEGVIHEGVTSADIATGIGHYKDTGHIGEQNNACYTGHFSVRFNCIFNKLPEIQLGAEIDGYNSRGKKTTYYVTKKYIVEPTDTWVLDSSRSKKLTIITCANNGTQRLIVEGIAYTKEQLRQMQEYNKQVIQDTMSTAVDDIGTVSICSYIKHRGRILHTIYIFDGEETLEGTRGRFDTDVSKRFLLTIKGDKVDDVS